MFLAFLKQRLSEHEYKLVEEAAALEAAEQTGTTAMERRQGYEIKSCESENEREWNELHRHGVK